MTFVIKYTLEEIELLNALKGRISEGNPPKITQDRLDKIIEELIKEKKNELLWRLCVTYFKYNLNKALKYYISNRDSYYIEELVSIISEDINQEYLVNEMIKTGDKEFIKQTLSESGNDMYYSLDPVYLEKLLDFIK